MTNNLFSILICPFCPSGAGEIQIDKDALRNFVRRHPKRKKAERLIDPSDEVFWFGYAPCRSEPCEHLFHTEVFISRGPLKPSGHLSHQWEATFRSQHKRMLELDADDIARNCLFESIYLREELTNPPDFRPATLHVVTNWLNYRWQDQEQDGEAIYVDVRAHAFLTEDFPVLLAELCDFAERQ
jgi:hypothetical protein